MTPEFHTLATLTLASRDGTGWTVEFLNGGVPHMIMGATPLEVPTKAAAHFQQPIQL